jgi:hypothetical protein
VLVLLLHEQPLLSKIEAGRSVRHWRRLTAEDPLTEVLRQEAQRLLAQAIEVEVAMLLPDFDTG